MIKKILELINIGSYAENPTKTCPEWNGEFKNKNIIYGENGSGKTTLAILFTSLSGNDALLKEKEKIGGTGNQKVKILMQDNSIIKYHRNNWDKHCDDISVFDIHYIEDNIYIDSSARNKTRNNLFYIVAGENGIKLNKKLGELHDELSYFRNARNAAKAYRREAENEYQNDAARLNDIDQQIQYFTNEIGSKVNHIKMVNIELGEHSQKTFEGLVDTINKYLQYFTPHIRLKKFSKKSSGPRQLVSYSLSVSGEIVGFEGLKGGAGKKIKYSLSEGDKSAFAFSFFLAQLEKHDLSSKIIIFDDPISSFDQARRSTTINQLINISSKCKQIFISTHDIYFAKALSRRMGAAAISLKISKAKNTSYLEFHDIEKETLNGIFKDINVLHSYLANGAASELERREVIRCIRPIIEGIIRIKYFNEIERGEWLGDILGKIESSQPEQRLYRLKPIAVDIQEINDYSKEFHHSDPTSPWGDIINHEELRLFVHRTLTVIDKI